MTYKRMSVLCAVILLTALSAGYLLATATPTSAASLSIGINGAANDEVHWTITGPTSVTLDWRGPSKSLRYGLTTAYGATATAVTPSPLPYSSAGPFWEAKLTGLQANTTYHYSIGGEADHTFKTALPKGSTAGFTVDVIADVGATTSYSRVGPVQALIAADHPSLAFLVGDLTYGYPNGQADVDQHFNDVQVWSLGSTAYMPAWGNHEWDTPTQDNLKNYKGRFDLPNPQTSPGSPAVSCCGEDWYYFDYGNTRFIVYPEPWSGAWADWNTKAKTLMDAAQADPAITFIVTFGHRPAYSSGYHSGDSGLKGYLDTLGATHSKYVLNLNGHSHNYERTFPQSNVVHITVGTGGSSLEQNGTCLWLICTQPSWSAKRYMRLGVLKLTFDASSIQGAFICGPSGGGTNDIDCAQGQVIDTFTILTQIPTEKTLTLNSLGVYDGWILESSETSGKGGILNAKTATFQLGDDALNRQYRAILSFDTSSLPVNAAITSATLRIKPSGKPVGGTNVFTALGSLLVDIKKGAFGKINLEAADFQARYTAKKVGIFGKTPVNGWYNVTLNTAGMNNISKGGTTQFRLYFAKDDNNNFKANFMKFFSGNAATGKPELIITYTVP